MRIATHTLVFAPLLLYFAACQAADTGKKEKDAEAEVPESPLRGMVEGGEGRKLFGTMPDEPPPSFIGCEGYLTNKSTQSYCSETVPDDWAAFEFEGEQFFLVPLAAAIDEFSHTNQSLQQTGED